MTMWSSSTMPHVLAVLCEKLPLSPRSACRQRRPPADAPQPHVVGAGQQGPGAALFNVARPAALSGVSQTPRGRASAVTTLPHAPEQQQLPAPAEGSPEGEHCARRNTRWAGSGRLGKLGELLFENTERLLLAAGAREGSASQDLTRQLKLEDTLRTPHVLHTHCPLDNSERLCNGTRRLGGSRFHVSLSSTGSFTLGSA